MLFAQYDPATQTIVQPLKLTTGPSSSTDNAVARYDGTTGKLFQNSAVTIADTTGVINIAHASGNVQVNGTDIFPTAVTANTIPKFSGTTGRAIVASGNTIDSSNNVTLVGNLSLPIATSSVGQILLGNTRLLHTFGPSSGFNSIFLGYQAGNFTLTGDANIMVGRDAGQSITTGNNNTGVGYIALRFVTTGQNNLAMGASTGAALTTGSNNSFVGSASGSSFTTGGNNTCVGASSGTLTTTGSSNTFIGYAAGTAALTGSSNTCVGAGAGSSYVGAESSNICIGNNGVAAESSVIRIGTGQTKNWTAGIRGRTTDVNDAIAVLIDSTGQLGTVSSSIRFKENVEDLFSRSQDRDSSSIIDALRPVQFDYKDRPSSRKCIGLIAEEVAEIYPDMVIKNQEGEIETVDYARLPLILLQEVKNLRKKLQDVEAWIKNVDGLVDSK
jgi:hypothetical protein